MIITLTEHALPNIIQVITNTMPSMAHHARSVFLDEDALVDRTMYGVVEGDDLVGICGLCNDMCTMSWFAVEKEYQRKGYGTLMLEHLLRVSDCDYILVETYLTEEFASANAFYLKNGFRFHSLTLPYTIIYKKDKQ